MKGDVLDGQINSLTDTSPGSFPLFLHILILSLCCLLPFPPTYVCFLSFWHPLISPLTPILPFYSFFSLMSRLSLRFKTIVSPLSFFHHITVDLTAHSFVKNRFRQLWKIGQIVWLVLCIKGLHKPSVVLFQSHRTGLIFSCILSALYYTVSSIDSHGWPGPVFRRDFKDRVWSINLCISSAVQ